MSVLNKAEPVASGAPASHGGAMAAIPCCHTQRTSTAPLVVWHGAGMHQQAHRPLWQVLRGSKLTPVPAAGLCQATGARWCWTCAAALAPDENVI